jgi:nicotinate-nucleotide pyrophosphorylase (carboxylating)
MFTRVPPATLITQIVFDHFTDIDVFLAWDLLNRVRRPDWTVKLLGTNGQHVSVAGLTIPMHGRIEESADADAVLIASGPETRALRLDRTYLGRLRLDPGRQLIGSMCSGALILEALGLLHGKRATSPRAGPAAHQGVHPRGGETRGETGEDMILEPCSVVVDRIVDLALEEDLGSGDLTTEACVDADARAVAHAVARGPVVVCGGSVFARVFLRVDATLVVESHVADGAKVEKGTKLWTVRGKARGILMGERVALNFVQRMTGVATQARRYVDALPAGSKTRITDTRKTTPGLRALERYAVRAGGAFNHRDDLGAAVLIKDNHIASCGGVRAAIERARTRAPHTAKIECEVDTLEQLDEALAARADIVLLDNMTTEQMAEAVRRAAGKALLEASGGMTPARIPEIAKAGVDAISVGAPLTHSATAADIGLDFE